MAQSEKGILKKEPSHHHTDSCDVFFSREVEDTKHPQLIYEAVVDQKKYIDFPIGQGQASEAPTGLPWCGGGGWRSAVICLSAVFGVQVYYFGVEKDYAVRSSTVTFLRSQPLELTMRLWQWNSWVHHWRSKLSKV